MKILSTSSLCRLIEARRTYERFVLQRKTSQPAAIIAIATVVRRHQRESPGKAVSTFEAAVLPGVNLRFSPSTDPVAGTQGRALDHIGFEVKKLEQFCKELASRGIPFARPFARFPERGTANALLTDPSGTSVELTEGLDKIK